MNDFLILVEPGEHHDLRLSWARDRSCIYLHSNGRTMSLSAGMANQLYFGLMAILKGDFDRALSEEALRLEKEEEARRTPLADRATPPISVRPNLDQL